MNKLMTAKGQKVVCLNIRSLYANHSQFELDFKYSGFYAICLTETWLKPPIAPGLVSLDRYSLIRNDRPGKKRGGGVCCYIRDDLTWSNYEDNFNVSTDDIEILTITIQRKKQKPLSVTTKYLPPSSCLTNALRQLELLSNSISLTEHDWILCGDFNIDYNSKTTQCKRLVAFANTNLLSQLITTATRITNTSSSLIDHMYTTLNPNLTTSGVIKYGLSDHDLIFVIIKKQSEDRIKENFSCRNCSTYTRERLSYELNSHDWSSFDEMPDVDKGWEILYNHCNSIVQCYVMKGGQREY